MNHKNTQVNPDLQSTLHQMTNSSVVYAAVIGYSSDNLKGLALELGHFFIGCELTGETFLLQLSQVMVVQ